MDMKNQIEVDRINKELGILSAIKKDFIEGANLVSGRITELRMQEVPNKDVVYPWRKSMAL